LTGPTQPNELVSVMVIFPVPTAGNCTRTKKSVGLPPPNFTKGAGTTQLYDEPALGVTWYKTVVGPIHTAAWPVMGSAIGSGLIVITTGTGAPKQVPSKGVIV
jgi:hypothetical protein